MLFIYNLLSLIAVGVLSPFWIPMVCLRKKYRTTMAGRWMMAPIACDGNDGEKGPSHRRIWIHALSVGEVMSAEPLVSALSTAYGAERLVFTASTRTGFQTAMRVMKSRVHAVRYFPYDLMGSIGRAIHVIRPQQVIIVETDIWPNVLMQLRRKRIPVHLVNARLSDRSWRGYMRLRPLMKRLLAIFSTICVQTDMDRRRFLAAGAPVDRLTTVGNIKFDQPAVRLSADDRDRLMARLNLPPGLPIWVAGSTHAGEERLLAGAYHRLQGAGMAPALVVAPRDPGRAGDVCRHFRRTGTGAVVLDQAPNQSPPPHVVVIDRIGMLRRLYAIADVTFVGGSLVDAGGHNPLEPASEAKPILMGPYTGDFHWMYRTLEREGGAMRVDDEQQLAAGLMALLKDRNRALHMGDAARRVFDQHRGAVQRTLAIIDDRSAGCGP